ncbi:MAG: EutN/CcmL family microcompartment protein [Pirellulaceae bacterium]|nr:EutN/CcmL family microcompartment protein [Pirellulaceae bacterium]
MQTGLVIGSAYATLQHSSLRGQKILVIQPERIDGDADGEPLLAIDTVGAGAGERIIITSDGRTARDLLKVDATPARWTVIGIQDE